jgi:hypothetical protein
VIVTRLVQVAVAGAAAPCSPAGEPIGTRKVCVTRAWTASEEGEIVLCHQMSPPRQTATLPEITVPSVRLLPRVSNSGIMFSRSRANVEGRFVEWHGPYPIGELLDNCLQQGVDLPPDSQGVYVVSKRSWDGTPTLACDPLYVGSTTGNSARFRTRVGDLIADMFGFFTTETAHHSGGQSLHKFCKESGIHPNQLYISWLSDCACVRCEEVRLYQQLRPKLNRKCPTQCNLH